MELIVKENSIHCANCEARIYNVLNNKNGIISVKANHISQVIQLVFDEGIIKLSEIKLTLNELGFPVP